MRPERDERWAGWVGALPRLVRELLDEWELVVDGDPVRGSRDGWSIRRRTWDVAGSTRWLTLLTSTRAVQD